MLAYHPTPLHTTTLPYYPTPNQESNMSKNTKALSGYNREISVARIDAIIDRTIERIDKSVDRLTGDMSLVQVIEIVYMLQDMRERERIEKSPSTNT